MRPLSTIAWLAALLCGLVASGGQAASRTVADFQQRAAVRTPAESTALASGEAYAVALASDAIAALGEQEEVRLFDGAGREIPSLLYRARERTAHVDRPAALFNSARLPDGHGAFTVSVELEGRHIEPVDEFRFTLNADNYSLRVRVEGSNERDVWQTVAEGLRLIRHRVSEESIRYAHDRVRIPSSRYRYYRFTMRSTLLEGEGDSTEELRVEKVTVRERAKPGRSLAIETTIEPYAGDRGAPHSDVAQRRTNGRVDEWKIDLGRAALGVNRLVLTLGGDDFARSATVWEWSEQRQRRSQRLASGVVFHFDDDKERELEGFATDARYVIVSIDQGDDRAVPLYGVTAYRPHAEVRFLAPGQATHSLALYFAPESVKRPRYDLARRLKERKVSDFAVLSHEPLAPNDAFAHAPEPRSEQVPWLLTGIVLTLIAGLGFFVYRTIQGSGAGGDAA